MQKSQPPPTGSVSASFVRRPSHPLFVTCPVDIYSKHDVVAVPGAVFGHHYGYNTALVYVDEHQGYVSGYDRDTCMWIIHGLNISMGSGHQDSKAMAAEQSLPKRLGRSGVNIIDLEADSASPVASTSRLDSQISVPSGSGIAVREDGEVLEPPPQVEHNEESFVNTFPKKRTGKEVVRDARKALKYNN